MRSIAAGLALAMVAWSQGTGPTFEVASIRPSTPAAGGSLTGQMMRTPGRVSYRYVSVQNLIAQAFRIKNFQMAGPDWLNSEHFDIEAILPRDATDEQIPAMLQALLRGFNSRFTGSPEP